MKAVCNKFLLIISIFILFSPLIHKAQDQSPINFGIHPSLGVTYTNSSETSSEVENLQWLLNLQSNLNYTSENFQFDSDLTILYGQTVAARQNPQKTQDDFLLNLIPSIRLMQSPTIRLFWQTKVETQMKQGILNNQQTGFLDPAFLTHTLFVGNKNQFITQTQEQNFQITYGIGYSFQQIIKKHFQLSNESQPSSNVDYIQGPTAVFNLTFTKQIKDGICANVSLSSLLLAKKDFLKSTSNSRFSSMLTSGIDFGILSIQYTNRLVYDKELSNRRQLDQTLVLGVKFSI